MKLRGRGSLRRVTRQLKNLFMPTGVILLYHRVVELPSDPQLLSVTPQHFAEHLEILRKLYQPLSLRQFSQALQNGSISRRTVVITFDDGYVDNLYEAKPLLEHYDVPATVFVTTGYIGQEHGFYWDELERLLLLPGELPETLQLSLNGSNYTWKLGPVTHYSDDSYQNHRHWSVLEKDDPTQRQYLYRILCQALRQLPEEVQLKALDDLREQINSVPEGRSTHRTLTSDEIICLTKEGLVEVGAHTVTHPTLSILPVVSQLSEIQHSKSQLDEILGFPVDSFSYPYGSESDYTMETVAMVQEAGFACACANFADVVWRYSDHFQLPRFLVRDWDGDEFARQLRAFLT